MIKLNFGVNNGNYPKKKITIAEVAIINEYGTDDIPPRPAFTIGFENSIKKHRKLIDAALANFANHTLTSRKDSLKRNLVQVLTQIGKSAKKETKDLIKSGSVEPGNAPSTIARKGFDHPLWEEGVLHDSVDYEVTED